MADETTPDAPAGEAADAPAVEATAPEAAAPATGGDEATAPQGAPAVEAAALPRGNRRKVREGVVVSDAMQSTVVVAVVDRVRHPRYGKTVQRTKRLYVHDAENTAKVGDRVQVAETRPISKLKHWRLVQVTERAR